MKKAFYISIVAIVLILFFVVWLRPNAKAPVSDTQQDNEAGDSKISEPVQNISTNQFESGNLNPIDKSVRIPTNLPTKGQEMQSILMEQNARPLDLYGTVVDQYGQPVVAATVEGSILLNGNTVSSGGDTHYTETDAQGRFKFLGVHGLKIGIRPKKEGYYYDSRLPANRPDDYVPDPNNPLIFKMWKVVGKEALVHSSMDFSVPFDGTVTQFNLAAQKQDADGDLQIVVSRSPTQVKRSGQKFDWSLKIEMLRGGLMANNDIYPFLAPDRGYTSSYGINVSSNDVPWRSTFTQNFYIKNSQQHFGRLRMDVYAGLTPARIHFDLWMNPEGSQNLEPDLSKAIE